SNSSNMKTRYNGSLDYIQKNIYVPQDFKKISVFDVDGTLSDLNKIPAELSDTLSPGYGFFIVEFPVLLHKNGLFPKKGFKGKSKEELDKLGKKYVESHREKKFSYTDGLINFVKEKGYLPVVVSASPIELILPFSTSIGIKKNVFAIVYETDKGKYTGEIILNTGKKEVKKQIVEEFSNHGIVLEESTGFGDSPQDTAFLELVGYPVVLNPNTKLEEIAKKRKWLVCKEPENVLDEVKLYIP
ncbi:MAG: HAD family phosphatase, partial [Candidatus Aenigmarchaeota archaeon]|nr:HAD family phosphatase [Candidatus Aenigmarchaeota archaeon]